jgi:hypothetical protein
MIDANTIDQPFNGNIRALCAGKLRGEVVSIRKDIAEDVARLEAAPQVIYETATHPIDQSSYPVGRQESHLSLQQRQSELAFVDSLLASDDLKFIP